jgi:hypothetical protein
MAIMIKAVAAGRRMNNPVIFLGVAPLSAGSVHLRENPLTR